MNKLAMVLVILLLLAAGIYATVAAPCDWFKYSAAKDIPGRCIMNEGK